MMDQYNKCHKIAPNDKFKKYLERLAKIYKTNNVISRIYMVLTCISMP